MQDRIETILRDYLVKTFKNENAIPNLLLKGIAEEITEHRWEIYNLVQEEYDWDDIETLAESNNIELTQDEKDLVMHRYKKLEDSKIENLSYIIDDVVAEREEK